MLLVVLLDIICSLLGVEQALEMYEARVSGTLESPIACSLLHYMRVMGSIFCLVLSLAATC